VIRVGGRRKSCYFIKKFLSEKRNVRQCDVVMQQPVLLSSKFGLNSSHISTQSL
jgi:hypothetical protein